MSPQIPCLTALSLRFTGLTLFVYHREPGGNGFYGLTLWLKRAQTDVNGHDWAVFGGEGTIRSAQLAKKGAAPVA